MDLSSVNVAQPNPLFQPSNEASEISLLVVTTAHNQLIRALILTSLVTFGRSTPWRYRMAPRRGLAFTTTMRVIDRVHRDTTYRWTNTTPTISTRFTDFAQIVFAIGHFTQRRT